MYGLYKERADLMVVEQEPVEILPVTAENLEKLDLELDQNTDINLSLPITSTYLRRMRGLSSEPKVNNFFLPPLFYVLLMQWV